MLRIRGTVGDVAVDLTLELEPSDWAQLGAQLKGEAAPESPPPTPAPTRQSDALWQTTLSLVEKAGQIDGPMLLAQLEGLSGSTAAGKRLLVRLRHCEQVNVKSGADAPLYCWVGQA